MSTPNPINLNNLDGRYTKPTDVSSAIDSVFGAQTVNVYNILALGTSIAAGIGASSQSTAYPSRIGANLQTISNIAFTVIGGGVSGDTTAQMLARLPNLLSVNKPAYVTIEASINDARSDFSITSATTLNNIRRMVGLCQQAGAIPILLTSAPMDPVWWNSSSYNYTSPAKAKLTNFLVTSFAKNSGIALVPIFDLMLDRTGVLADGLHPNDIGHDIWGLAIAQTIAAQSVSDSRVVRMLDTFDRANASSFGTATDGKVWDAPVSGTFSIVNNEGLATASNGYGYVFIDAGVSDVVVRARVPSVVSEVGLMARGINANNFYLADLNTASGVSGLYVYRCIAGAYQTIVSSYVINTLTPGNDISFSVQGTHLSVAINDVIVWSYTDSGGSALNGGTKVGLWNNGSVTPRPGASQIRATN